MGQLGGTKAIRAVRVGPVTRELQTVMIEARGPDGPLTVVVEVLYSGTAMITDAYVFPGPLTHLITDVERNEGASKRGYGRAIRPDFHDSAFYDVAGFGWDWEMDIGGSAVLDEVDTEPLPTEGFSSKGLSRKVAKPARAVAREIERVAPGFFHDPELTTAAQRVPRKLCEDVPGYITSKSAASKPSKPLWETSVAASICWLVGKGNNWFNRCDPDTTVKALAAAFGLKSSPGSRGKTLGSRMLSAQRGENRWHLGDPALLTSARRRNVLHEAKTSEDDPWLRL